MERREGGRERTEGGREGEQSRVSLIHSTNTNCPTDARLFPGIRGTALERRHSFASR